MHGRTVDEQLDHVRARFGLTPTEARLFTRCSVCNALLVSIAKDAVRERVPPKAFDRYDAFWTCRPCDKVYWKGSHYDEMLALLHAARARG
ncbi:MAG: Mut7-C RNAse domain-containing protein [Polyangiaceae bacterium]